MASCTWHYEVNSKDICSNSIMYLSLWSSFHSPVCKYHSVSVIMKLFPQLSALLTLCTCHYEAIPTVLFDNDIRYMSLWSSFHSSVCHWHSVCVIMKLLPQVSLLLIFCTCHYEAPFTAICVSDILYMSLWTSFHSYLWYRFPITVIMKLHPLSWVLLIFCTSEYEALSTYLCATDNLYMSSWSSIHSIVWYWHSVPDIMKLIPQLCVILIFCTWHYETLSTALFNTDTLYLP